MTGVDRLVPKKSLCQKHEICSDPISADPIRPCPKARRALQGAPDHHPGHLLGGLGQDGRGLAAALLFSLFMFVAIVVVLVALSDFVCFLICCLC